jgi:hypothetical protein
VSGGDLVGPVHLSVSFFLIVSDDLLGNGDHSVGFNQTVVKERSFTIVDDIPGFSLVGQRNHIRNRGERHIDLRSSGDGREVESLFGLSWLESVLRRNSRRSDRDGLDSRHIGDSDRSNITSGNSGFISSSKRSDLVNRVFASHESSDRQVLDIIVESGERRVLDSDSDSLGNVEHLSVLTGGSGGFDSINRVGDNGSWVTSKEFLESGRGVIFVEDQDGGGVRSGELGRDSSGEGDVVDGVGQLDGFLFGQIGGSGSRIELDRFDSSVVGRLVDHHIVGLSGTASWATCGSFVELFAVESREEEKGEEKGFHSL